MDRFLKPLLALQAGPSRVDNEDGVGECPDDACWKLQVLKRASSWTNYLAFHG